MSWWAKLVEWVDTFELFEEFVCISQEIGKRHQVYGIIYILC